MLSEDNREMLSVREAPLVLASRSQQRLALLARLGLAPRLILPVDINETALKKESARALVSRLALAKAEAAQEQLGKREAQSNRAISHILAADTAILCARRILGKPRDAQQAAEFLKMLSGRRHQVYTALVLAELQQLEQGDGKDIGKDIDKTATSKKISIRLSTTRVAFKRLMQKEIEEYLETKEWQDSAGAYRIQGFAEAFVRSINGSYSSVVGLPLFETRQLLLSQNLL